MSPAGDDPGPLIGSGRAADVYDIGDGRVLRRNRTGAGTEREAAVMRHLWRHGYPVPEVHHADGADLVMDRAVKAQAGGDQDLALALYDRVTKSPNP